MISSALSDCDDHLDFFCFSRSSGPQVNSRFHQYKVVTQLEELLVLLEVAQTFEMLESQSLSRYYCFFHFSFSVFQRFYVARIVDRKD